MKKIIVVLLIVFAQSVYAQKIVISGIATQNTNGLSNEYPMVLELKKSKNKITGTSFFITPNGTAFVYYKLKGVQSGDKFQLEETKISKGTEINGYWILKVIELSIVNSEVTGSWKDSKSSGISGEFKGQVVQMISK